MAEQIYQQPTLASNLITPTASSVYSPENVTQTLTQPAPKPNLSDPFGLYEQYMKSPDILATQQQVSDTQKAINASQQALRGTTRALEGQNIGAMGGTGASVNLIGQQVGRARQLTADELAGLGENLQAQTAYLNTLQSDAQNRYQIAQQERAQLQDLIRQTGGKANITYSDSYETALQKASKYEEKVKEDTYKSDLKKTLQSLGLSLKTKKGGTLDTKGMEKKLTEYYKKQDISKKEMEAIEKSIKLKELNKPYYKPEGESKDDLTTEGTQGINSFFDNVKGDDGKVSPQDWAEAKSQWAQNGLSTASFNAIFGKWKDSNDKYL